LSSLDDLQSEFLEKSKINTENVKELADFKDRHHRQTELTKEYEQQINNFKLDCHDLKGANEILQLDLSKVQDKVTSFESETVDLKEKLNVLTEDLRIQTDERVGLEDELDVAKQQLESANEGRIRAEHAQVKAQEELENLRCMMDQEVAALKFQLSSETIKFETEIKVCSFTLLSQYLY
jgi:chromosome segregation ATPase